MSEHPDAGNQPPQWPPVQPPPSYDQSYYQSQGRPGPQFQQGYQAPPGYYDQQQIPPGYFPPGYAQPGYGPAFPYAHRGSLILILGITSLVLLGGFCCCGGCVGIASVVLGILALVLGEGDLRKMDCGYMDNSGRGLTSAGRICGIIGLVLGTLALLGQVVLIILPHLMAA